MKTAFRLFAALCALAFAQPAAATTSSTDYTDLWYLPSESGWGVNVIQQGDIVFATFFVYGADGSPRWFVMPEGRSVASSPGQNTFTGGLFQTQGTYYGSPWGGTPSNSTVGSATLLFTSPISGTLTYSVNGVNVSKSISRQTWRGNTLTGNYVGGVTANATGCRNPSDNGQMLQNGRLFVGHSNFFNPSFRIEFFTVNGAAGVCTYNGGYVQDGKLGRVNSGTFGCTIAGSSSPPVGTFTLTQIEANVNGFTARFNGADQYCNYDGYFGGVRDVL